MAAVERSSRTVQPTVLLRPGGVCVQTACARKTSTFGNNLIERLRTRSVECSTSRPSGRRLDCAREEFAYRRTRQRASGEQIVLYVFFAGCSLKSPTTEILSMASEHLKTLG